MGWDKLGSIWLHRRKPDGAGNSQQYMLGIIKMGGKVVKFAGHPNPNKTADNQPDWILFVKPQGE